MAADRFDAYYFAGRLLTLRIIWFALMAGVVSFAIVVQTVVIPQQQLVPLSRPHAKMLVLVNLLLLVIELPVAFLIRAVIFRRGRTAGGISGNAYVNGNFIFWVCCEVPAFFGLIIAMLCGSLFPTIWIVVTSR